MKKIKFIVKIMITLVIGLLLAIFLLPRAAKAQPYYTNAAPYGAATYNQSFPTPLRPSQVLANQYSAGTLAGYIATNQTPFFFVTNTFSTNVFSTAPFVVANCDTNGIPATNNVVRICSTTTSNFVCQVLATNCGIYWEATGH